MALAPAEFEDRITTYVWDHHLTSLNDLAERFGIANSAAKQDAAVIVQRFIDDGPPEISMADLEARGVSLKTVRVPEQADGNRPYEPMTFPAFDPFELIEESWETSQLGRELKRLLLVVLRGKDGPLRKFKIDFAFFWSPSDEQDALIRAEWEDVRRLIATGRATDLPKATDTTAIHVKPKGTSGADLVPAPGGVQMRRSGFALNQDFVEGLIDDEV